jgi:hypothetical protein
MNCYCNEKTIATVRFCDLHHRYFMGDVELDSVSRVIAKVYPKKSFDGVNPAVIERARERGVRVDRYLEQYVSTGDVLTDLGEWIEVRERLDRCIKWWDQNMNGVKVICQPILFNARERVAGKPDFRIGDFILDLKNTASPEPSWKLQFGGYAEMGNAQKIGALHSTKDAVRLYEYNAAECRDLWNRALDWRAAIAELERK